jgi:hypothetical protein
VNAFAGNNFGDTADDGLAGPMGLLIIVLLAIATVLLIRNMNSRLRRLPERFPDQRVAGRRPGAPPAPPAGPQGSGTPSSGTPSSGTPSSGTQSSGTPGSGADGSGAGGSEIAGSGTAGPSEQPSAEG